MSDATPGPVEEFPDVEEAPDGQPLVAVFFAVAAIIAGTIFMPVPPLEGAFARIVAVGVGTVAAAILWGVAWFATIRHSSLGWKLGSFALIWLAGVVTLDRCIDRSYRAMKNEMGAVSDIKLDPEGRPALPEKTGNLGPITSMLSGFFKATNDDMIKTESQIGELNLEILNDAYRTQADPSVVEDCERADKGKPLVRDFAKRQTKRAADLKAQAEAMWLPEADKEALLKTVAQHSGANRLTEQAEIQAKMFDEWRIRCTILQRGKWKAWGPIFQFTSPSDLAEMRVAAERHTALRIEYNALFGKALREVNALNMGLRMP
ncbi:hypothetical protein [Sphingomonas sp. G-3-2-10]|uniref:hypothetical protein n=1 Tax=Sphingomonas sp. G-3-2-10 TaxID=2728838 RepID=UPI00146F44C3|nr:hypothetical protein [Sphingomonas sp. G-3-2-10]NML07744.1 hypothetical protein [Sphingomonas sp. G-3-2-10]